MLYCFRNFARVMLYFCCSTVVAYSAQQQNPAVNHQLLFSTITQQFIIPTYARLHETTKRLQASSTQLCNNPSEGHLKHSQQAWLDAMLGWQAANVVLFGPLITSNAQWRMQFYYDRKNLVEQKIKKQLKLETPITPDTISAASVAVQGFPALELLLFKDFNNNAITFEAFQPGSKRCELLVSIAANTVNIATDLHQKWLDQQDLMPHSELDVLTPYLNSLANKTKELTDKKFLRVLGLHLKKPRINAYRLEAWRSQQSLAIIEQQIQSLEQFYLGRSNFQSASKTAYGIDDFLLSKNFTYLDKDIKQTFATIRELLATSPKPLFPAVQQPQHLEHFQALAESLLKLTTLFNDRVPEALDVIFGFNASDGD